MKNEKIPILPKKYVNLNSVNLRFMCWKKNSFYDIKKAYKKDLSINLWSKTIKKPNGDEISEKILVFSLFFLFFHE